MTTGADGLARMWDVREACLKRYGKVIGRRPEYRLRLVSQAARQDHPSVSESNPSSLHSPQPQADKSLPMLGTQQGHQSLPAGNDVRMETPQRPSVALPPVPVPAPVVPLPVPPLPPAAPADNAIAPADDEHDPGAFVANDAMDEGVQLLLRLKHVALQDESAFSPGARNRRSPIKVICLARCPRGGHFATGADDGVCRVWRDEDDPLVEQVDSQFFQDSDRQQSSPSSRHGSSREREYSSF